MLMSPPHADPDHYIGRSPDTLSLPERFALAGHWIALELYSPQRLPLRQIEAIGDSPATCRRQLEARGLNPAHFELHLLDYPY